MWRRSCRRSARAATGSEGSRRSRLRPATTSRRGRQPSARIEPGASRVVHHVILFKETPAQVAETKRLDAASAGLGWPCFGGTGIGLEASAGGVEAALNDANWISAWAPGWGGGRLPDGNGV